MSSENEEELAEQARRYWQDRRIAWAAIGYFGVSDGSETEYWKNREVQRRELDGMARRHSAPRTKVSEWKPRWNTDFLAWWNDPTYRVQVDPSTGDAAINPVLGARPEPILHEGESEWTGPNAHEWRKVWVLRMVAYAITAREGEFCTDAFISYQDAEDLRKALLLKEGRFSQVEAWAYSQEVREFPPVQAPKITKHPFQDDIREVVKP